MPDDTSDHLLEQNRRRFFERLSAGEVPLQEARSVLDILKVQMNFLQTLLEKVRQAAEFAGQTADIEKAIQEEKKNLHVVETYVSQREQSSD